MPSFDPQSDTDVTLELARLRARVAALLALQEVAQEVTAELDLDRLLHKILRAAVTVMHGTAGSAFTSGQDEQCVRHSWRHGDFCGKVAGLRIKKFQEGRAGIHILRRARRGIKYQGHGGRAGPRNIGQVRDRFGGKYAECNLPLGNWG